MKDLRPITPRQLSDIEFDIQYRYHSLLCNGADPKEAKEALKEELNDIKTLRKYTERSQLLNVWFDIALSTTQVGLKAFNAMNFEALYPITDSIDDTNKTYALYITPYSFKKPSKGMINWFVKYIYRTYGYTCINA